MSTTDNLFLTVDDVRIENFLSYTVEADIYTTDAAFALQLANPETAIKAGQRCELYVNDTLELTGVIDDVMLSYDKRERRMQVQGRDLMGLLVDSYCERFITLKDKTLKEIAEELLETVPFIDKSKIQYQEGMGGGDSMETADDPHKFVQVEPGMTVFEALKRYAESRGMMFFSLPDGSLVFGRPKASGDPAYNLVCRKDGQSTNVLEGMKITNISKRYSKVTVIGQQQGRDDVSAEDVNTDGTVEDEDFPFYKPYVTTDNNDSMSPAKRARKIMEQQRGEGMSLTYTVPHFSQNGRNYTTNELAQVDDDVLDEHGTWLVFHRTYEMSRHGTFTRLQLGPPGLIR